MNSFLNKLNTIISNKKFEFFLLISFLIIFSSINTKPEHFYNLNYSIFSVFNFLRFTLPFLIIIPLIYLNIRAKKINKIILLFIIMFSCHVVGALINNKIIGPNIQNFYLVLDALGILLIINLVEYKQDLYDRFLKIIFLILIFAFTLYLIKYFDNYFNGTGLYLYDFPDFYSSTIMKTTLAHSSGVARVALFILVFLTIYTIIYKKYFLYITFINIFLLSLIWGFQSRGSIILLLIFYSFIIFIKLLRKINFKIFIIPLNIILALIIWEIIFVSKTLIFFQELLEENKIKSPMIVNNGDENEIVFGYLKKGNFIFNLSTIKYNRFSSTTERYFKVTKVNKENREKFLKQIDGGQIKTPSENEKVNSEVTKPYYNVNDAPITSGRTVIWKRILSSYDYKKIFGYGYQGDRFILKNLNKENTTFGTNSSNGYIYTFASGGYLALGIFVFINILSLNKVLIFLRRINKSSNKQKKFFGIIASSLIIIILARSLIENSHSFFGIDFIIFVFNFLYLNKINKYLKSS